MCSWAQLRQMVLLLTASSFFRCGIDNILQGIISCADHNGTLWTLHHLPTSYDSLHKTRQLFSACDSFINRNA